MKDLRQRTAVVTGAASGIGRAVATRLAREGMNVVATPHIAPYNIAEFGVVALTETLARELAVRKSPIGASVLCPGAVNTQIVTSERNRPAASKADHKGSTEEDRFVSFSSRLLAEQGLDPMRVADRVVQAIRERRFWILTHEDWKRVLQERVAALVADDALSSGFGG